MSGTLVGPLPTVTFTGGPGGFRNPARVAYDVPANTMDLRYATCRDHHVACDCREATFAEERSEFLGERRAVERAVAEVLFGHPTCVYQADGREAPGCMCTGCQIVRKADVGLLRFDAWVQL